LVGNAVRPPPAQHVTDVTGLDGAIGTINYAGESTRDAGTRLVLH
jgi:hypothetical protein